LTEKITDTSTSFNETLPRVSEWKRFQRVFLQRKVVLFGLIILVLLIITAILSPFLAPFDPYQNNLKESLQQPSWNHFLGTDLQGRDTLSRLIYGSRTALIVGFGSVLLAGVVGITLGMVAGYVGGITNMIIMRIMDALMGFPMILLALVIAAVLGSGLHNVIIALSVATLPGYARVMHGLTLTIRENDFILAQHSMGASRVRTMFWHILPNGLPPMIVLITLQLGALILAEAGLSFLGLGISPGEAAWGAMVSDGRRYLLTYPWLSLAPGFAIMLVVFAFNLVGDGLRDALDPRLRGLI
jgi:peptide/nickel transport system permease protein/oligopeptide transport system permease protein